MKLPDYEPEQIEDWGMWHPEFVYTLARFMEELEIERRFRTGGYTFTQDLTAENARQRRLAFMSALVIKGILDMLSRLPDWNVQPELDRILGGLEK